MESTKKTTKPTPKVKKALTEKKPRATLKSPIVEEMPELDHSFSQKDCCGAKHKRNEKAIYLLMIVFLLVNFVLA